MAGDEINYRHFFDIHELAGLRMERAEVFDATHGLVLELVECGALDGLRIDHPDGLTDPAGYLGRLGAALAAARPQGPPVYLVVEKILAAHEHLPEDWPVAGTTGYDFSRLVNGLLIDPAGERPLRRLYTRYTGQSPDFEALLYRCKRLIMRGRLSSGLTLLADALDRIAQADRHTRDFTLNGLRRTLTELVACFPVYRSYITAAGASEADRRHLQWAFAQARKRLPAGDLALLGFVERLLLDGPPAPGPVLDFALRLQQYTAPVMAKGLEDTAGYLDHRLIPLNEVGSDPRLFATTLAAFHHHNAERARRWPQAMLNTSTHDSKRSEDLRARLDVLSERPQEWGRHLRRWRLLNRRHRRRLEQDLAPSRNDEYLAYQTLLGLWPPEPPDARALAELGGRLEAYLIKAAREAKRHSTWINPDPDYEAALTGFARALLAGPEGNPFLADFAPYAERLGRLGLLGALSQTLIKLTAPGVPDLYQGSELWSLRLVDPDSRRPVDFARRAGLLEGLEQAWQATADRAEARRHWLRGLWESPADGRLKLLVSWRALALRRRWAEVFRVGDYLPLEAEGGRAGQLCAYARRHGDRVVLCLAPRWFGRLCGPAEADEAPGPGFGYPPLGEAVWGDTRLPLPEGLAGLAWTDWLSGARHPAPDRAALRMAGVFGELPLALLAAGPD